MKDLQDQLNEELGQVNEARNYPYHVALITSKGNINVTLITSKGNINVTITLKNANDADAMDEWLEDQIDNSIYAADGGPNDVEI